MKTVQLLLGIEDSEYAQRLLGLLMAQGFGDGIHLYTDPDFFGEEMEQLSPGMYDAAVLTTAFLEEAETCGLGEKIRQNIPCIRHLLATPTEEAKTEKVLYQYRPAGALLDLLGRLAKPQNAAPAVSYLYETPVPSGKPPEQSHPPVGQKTTLSDHPYPKRWIWISPCHHELLEATALLAAKEQARQGAVWLVDLQQNSMLDRILQRAEAKTVTDAVYLLGAHEDALTECAVFWEGVQLLLPAVSIQEIGQLTKEHWGLLDGALQREQTPCFLLVDSVGPGFELLAEHASRCVVVTRDEARSRESGERLLEYMNRQFPDCPVQTLTVPFSSGGIAYPLWQQTVLRDVRLQKLVRTEVFR